MEFALSPGRCGSDWSNAPRPLFERLDRGTVDWLSISVRKEAT
jgi:hypothetical protein